MVEKKRDRNWKESDFKPRPVGATGSKSYAYHKPPKAPKEFKMTPRLQAALEEHGGTYTHTPESPKVAEPKFSYKINGKTPEEYYSASDAPKSNTIDQVAASKARKQARTDKTQVKSAKAKSPIKMADSGMPASPTVSDTPVPKAKISKSVNTPEVTARKAAAKKENTASGRNSGYEYNSSSRSDIAVRTDQAKVPKGSDREADHANDLINHYNRKSSASSGESRPYEAPSSKDQPITLNSKRKTHVPISERKDPSATYYSHHEGNHGSYYKVEKEGRSLGTFGNAEYDSPHSKARYDQIREHLAKGTPGHVLAQETSSKRSAEPGRSPEMEAKPHESINKAQFGQKTSTPSQRQISTPGHPDRPRASPVSKPQTAPQSTHTDVRQASNADLNLRGKDIAKASLGAIPHGLASAAVGIGKTTVKAAKAAHRNYKESVVPRAQQGWARRNDSPLDVRDRGVYSAKHSPEAKTIGEHVSGSKVGKAAEARWSQRSKQPLDPKDRGIYPARHSPEARTAKEHISAIKNYSPSRNISLKQFPGRGDDKT